MRRDFRSLVLSVVSGIPEGKVMTYGAVARVAGRPGAARAVGSFMRQNSDDSVPCHRVIRSDMCPGRYNRGEQAKVDRLKEEGVSFNGLRIDESSLYESQVFGENLR